MSGIVAAHRLRQAGVDVRRSSRRTPTSAAPGSRTPTPAAGSTCPTTSTATRSPRRGDWPQYFSTQAVLLDYFRPCADELGLRPLHPLRHRGARRRARRGRAGVDACAPRGRRRRGDAATADAVVSARRPAQPAQLPRHPRAATASPARRSTPPAGTTTSTSPASGSPSSAPGASAAQFIPDVAEQAGELTVFQRTPPWLIPTPELPRRPSPDGLRVAAAPRARLRQLGPVLAVLAHARGPAARWPRSTRSGPTSDASVSLLNELIRQLLTALPRGRVPRRPSCCAKVLPDLPAAGQAVHPRQRHLGRARSRATTSSSSPTGIAEITDEGRPHRRRRRARGRRHHLRHRLPGVASSSRRCRSSGAAASTCTSGGTATPGPTSASPCPGFPNLFLLYGPNTNIVVNGSIIYFSECEVHYIVECVRLLLERGHRAMDCRPEVHDAYNERIDAGQPPDGVGRVRRSTAGTRTRRAASPRTGRSRLLEYWQRTREPDPDDYVLS